MVRYRAIGLLGLFLFSFLLDYPTYAQKPAVPTQISCADGKLNGDETDIDCGGSCTPCMYYRTCKTNNDCYSCVCRDGGSCSSAESIPNYLCVNSCAKQLNRKFGLAKQSAIPSIGYLSKMLDNHTEKELKREREKIARFHLTAFGSDLKTKLDVLVAHVGRGHYDEAFWKFGRRSLGRCKAECCSYERTPEYGLLVYEEINGYFRVFSCTVDGGLWVSKEQITKYVDFHPWMDHILQFTGLTLFGYNNYNLRTSPSLDADVLVHLSESKHLIMSWTGRVHGSWAEAVVYKKDQQLLEWLGYVDRLYFTRDDFKEDWQRVKKEHKNELKKKKHWTGWIKVLDEDGHLDDIIGIDQSP